MYCKMPEGGENAPVGKVPFISCNKCQGGKVHLFPAWNKCQRGGGSITLQVISSE